MLASDGTKEGRKGRIGKVMTGRGVSVSLQNGKSQWRGESHATCRRSRGFVVAADRLRRREGRGRGDLWLVAF